VPTRFHTVLATSLATILLAAAATAQPVQFRTLALSGQPAPGLPAGVNFSSFDAFTMNASGKVGMFATVTGTGVTGINSQGIWWDVPGSLQLVMRLGNAAPGQPTFNYISTTAPNLSDSGIMTYVALVAPTGGGGRDSLWTIGPSSAPAAFAVGVTQVPGLAAGTQWDSFSVPRINASGVMAFRAILRSVGTPNSHWIGTPGSLALASRDGDPTILPGVNFTGVLNDYLINSAGTFASFTRVDGAGVTATNNQVVWSRSTSGGFSIIARSGDPAPGIPGAIHSSLSSDLDLSRSSTIAFFSILTGAGITSANNACLWLSDAGTTTLLAREGDQAPSLPAGVLFGSSLDVIFGGQVAGQDTLVLLADLQGAGVVASNRSAIYKRVGTGPLTLVARAGTPAAGISPAVDWDDFDGNANIAMNAAGRIMMAALLTNGREGLWLEDAAGALQLVLVEQTSFDINDDPGITVLKTISSLAYPPIASDDDGRRSAFSDTGEVVFRLAFTDGTSGAFLARLPAGCDDIDFNNNDVFPEDQDVIDFFNVLAGAECPTCNDIDFNNNQVFPEDADVIDFFNVLAGGTC
jgi:hypothetical protein